MNDQLLRDDSPEKPSRHIYIWLLSAFGTLMFVVCFWIAWQWIVPGPALVVSRETTFLTEPLRPDGTPDYERWMLDKYHAGVTPENNAGVLLYQAIWPSELDPADYQPVCDELGLKEVPQEADALQPLHGQSAYAALHAWLRDQGGTALDDDSAHFEFVTRATSSAWTSVDIAPFADWVKSNQKALDLIVAASGRPCCYLPSPSLLNDDHDMLIAMLLPGTQGIREAARGLAARSMWHLGEGRLNDAWSDTLALHRLACLAVQGHTIVEKLVAIANRGMAQNATIAILGDQQLPLELARQIQADLTKLDCPVDMADALGKIERLSELDGVVHMKLYGVGVLSKDFADRGSEAMYSTIDWNVVLAGLNESFDRISAALAIEDLAARQQALATFAADLRKDGKEKMQPRTLLTILMSRRARTELVAASVANLMLPPLQAAMSAQDRNTALSQLVDVAAALAVYRAEHGEYPEQLQALVPSILPAQPIDLFHANPFVYRRDDNGYLLYCLGEDGIADGGSNHSQSMLAGRKLDDLPPDERPDFLDKIPAEADDISIRLPRPTFSLPTPSESP